jgi:hypothetical protein
MRLEGTQAIKVSRFDNEPEVPVHCESLIKKPINIRPTAPTHSIETKAKSTHYEHEFA